MSILSGIVKGRGELAAMVLWPMLFAGLTTCGLPVTCRLLIAALVAWPLPLTATGTPTGVPSTLNWTLPEVTGLPPLVIVATKLVVVP